MNEIVLSPEQGPFYGVEHFIEELRRALQNAVDATPGEEVEVVVPEMHMLVTWRK